MNVNSNTRNDSREGNRAADATPLPAFDNIVSRNYVHQLGALSIMIR